MSNDLQEMLSETASEVQAREREAFGRVSSEFDGRIVLAGAGGLGEKTLRVLRSAGAEPLAFTDWRPDNWGRTREGLTILEPTEAARRYGDSAVFLITVWNERMKPIHDQITALNRLGARRAVPFAMLAWGYAGHFLPHMQIDLPSRLHAQRENILRCGELLADQSSRDEYSAQLRWRLFGDFSRLAKPAAHPQYFDPGLIHLDPQEVFVDCGAFDGDTIQAFLGESGGRFHSVCAFEPDPANFVRLEQRVSALPRELANRISIRREAVGAENREVLFAATGMPNAGVSSAGTIVNCVAIDSVFGDGAAPTFIKMDLEAYEPLAIQGAARTIRRHAPKMAVCVYHEADHLWRIPLQLHELMPKYRLYLRPYGYIWELVCYAIRG
jgi:FkbM family methyltransferase